MESNKLIKIWNKFLYARDLESMKIKADGLAKEQKLSIDTVEDEEGVCKIFLNNVQLKFIRQNYCKESSPPLYLLFPLIQKTEKFGYGNNTFLYPLFLLELDKKHLLDINYIQIDYDNPNVFKPLSHSFDGLLDTDVNEVGTDLPLVEVVANLVGRKVTNFSEVFTALNEYINENTSRNCSSVVNFDFLISPFEESQSAQFQIKEYEYISRQDVADKYPLIELYLTKNGADSSDEFIFKPVYGLYEKQYPLGQGQVKAICKLQENELVAVQGAPGTGKTTLFRSIIANRIVARALLIIKDSDENKSVLVVSTANTAVDNVIQDLRSDDDLGEISWLYIRSGAKKRLEEEFSRVDDLISELEDEEFNEEKHEKLAQSILLKKAKIDDDYNKFIYIKDVLQPITSSINQNLVNLYFKSPDVRILLSKLIDNNYFRFPRFLHKLFGAKIKELVEKFNIENKNLVEVFDIHRIDKEALESLYVIHSLARKGLNESEIHCLASVENEENYSTKAKPKSIRTLIDKNLDSITVFARKYHGDQYLDYFRNEFISLNRDMFISSCRFLYGCMVKDKKELIPALQVWKRVVFNDKDAHQTWVGNYERFYQLISLAYPVMASTLASASKLAIRKFGHIADYKPFDLCLCDEAGMISSHDMLSVLSRCKSAVIVGDPLQLEPINSLSRSTINEIEEEYFDSENDVYKYSPESVTAYHRAAGCATGAFNDVGDGILLDEHRRCQKPIAELFIDIAGYKGIKIKTDRPNDKIISPFKNMGEQHFLFYSVEGRSGKLPNTNLGEVEAIGELLNKLEKIGYDLKKDIGLITPYSNQKRLLINNFAGRLDHSYKNEKIGSVHKFQGAEFEVIIYSPVIYAIYHRSEFQNRKPNLLNVSISRAKQQFFVVGNFEKLVRAGGYLQRMAETVAESNLIRMEVYTDTAKRYEKKESRKNLISNCKHIEIYEEAFIRAEQSVIIVTPWILSSYNDREHKIEPIKRALERGVDVKIYYGWKNIKYGTDEDGDQNVIKEMKDLLGKNFIRLNNGTHEKTLIVDTRAAVIGSWNWLSHNYYNICKQNQLDTLSIRDERSVVITDSNQISDLINLITNR